MHVKGRNSLDLYPTKNTIRMEHDKSGWCQCYSPVPQRLVVWGATQCLKCGKKLPDD